MVTFQNTIKLGFQHYFDFNGRSTRSEYWWWVLFVVITGIVLSLVDMTIGTYNYQDGNGIINGVFKIATLIPSLALGARRLHDINKSGWWLLMWLSFLLIIPIVILLVMWVWLWFAVFLFVPMILATITLLVWATKQGDNGPNKYGPDHRQDTRLLVPDQVSVCRQCQTELAHETKFCPECGTQVFQR